MPAAIPLEGVNALPYTAAEHVASVNSLPSTFGQLGADNVFPAEGLDTPFVKIEMDNGVIRALPVTPEGRPSTIARHDKPESFIFEIPNVSHEDSILASDIRKWLAVARRSRDVDETLATLIEKRHRKNRLKFDMTLEVMRMGALRGRITDGDNQELYDLYEVFGLTEQVVYFDLDNANTDVAAKIEEVVSLIEDNLTDETSTGVEARVSPVFFNKLIAHAKFQKFFLNTPAALQLLTQARSQVAGQFMRTFDTQAGLVLKEYRAKTTTWSGNAARLIADGEGHAYPTGTIDTAFTHAAPPLDMDELEGAADVADLIHMTTERMKHNRGEEWAYQMNALPLWARPKTLVRLDDGPQV